MDTPSLKVIGNTGSNSTGAALQATEQGFAVGMHASLHINPYYGKTSMPGLLAHFNSVLPMGPMIIYNMPSRTGQDILPSVIQTLAASPNFVGVKECLGNDRVRQYAEEGKTVWCGMDHECHDARWDLGATGAMSVPSNFIPGLMRELVAGKKSFAEQEDHAFDRMAPPRAGPDWNEHCSGSTRGGPASFQASLCAALSIEEARICGVGGGHWKKAFRGRKRSSGT